MAARGGLVYHWRHGWIPRDHIAALQKAHGSHKGAARIMQKHGIEPPTGHHDTGSSARLSIRAAAYRGEAGHLVTGKNTRGQRVSVFAPNRAEAEKAAENMRAGRPAFGDTPKIETPNAAARVQVEHSGDGTLLHIDRSDTGARDAAKAAGFKWSSNLGSWYLPRNWSESTRRSKVNALQDKLGHGNVHVTDAGHGVTTSAAEREAATRARATDRAARMDARSAKATSESQSRFDRAHQIADAIPMGQPILAGHHSQRRHERDLARMGSNMDKAIAADKEAKDAAAAAERARQTAAGDSPLLRQRRIDRNEAEVRKIDRTLEHHDLAVKLTATKPEAAAKIGLRPLAPEHHSQITAARAELVDQIAHDKAQIAASGHQGVTAAQIAPGDLVQYRGRPHVVKKVNKTTVSVPTGYSWDDKVPINQISKHIKLADMPVTAIRSAIASEKDPKVREHFVRELNRRGLHITP